MDIPEIVGSITAILALAALVARGVLRLHRLLREVERIVPTLREIADDFPNNELTTRLLDIEGVLDRQAEVITNSVVDMARNSVRIETMVREMRRDLRLSEGGPSRSGPSSLQTQDE